MDRRDGGGGDNGDDETVGRAQVWGAGVSHAQGHDVRGPTVRQGCGPGHQPARAHGQSGRPGDQREAKAVGGNIRVNCGGVGGKRRAGVERSAGGHCEHRRKVHFIDHDLEDAGDAEGSGVHGRGIGIGNADGDIRGERALRFRRRPGDRAGGRHI